mmetsp:Transcript_22989/g.58520  ORF Transcript_22989/g.58520 Transcript_22989/m.58520 type:complete len:243 (-) Transcript_22989:597-1325(-)
MDDVGTSLAIAAAARTDWCVNGRSRTLWYDRGLAKPRIHLTRYPKSHESFQVQERGPSYSGQARNVVAWPSGKHEGCVQRCSGAAAESIFLGGRAGLIVEQKSLLTAQDGSQQCCAPASSRFSTSCRGTNSKASSSWRLAVGVAHPIDGIALSASSTWALTSLRATSMGFEFGPARVKDMVVTLPSWTYIITRFSPLRRAMSSMNCSANFPRPLPIACPSSCMLSTQRSGLSDGLDGSPTQN